MPKKKEKLDEISKPLLGRYIKAAALGSPTSASMDNARDNMEKAWQNPKVRNRNDADNDPSAKKHGTRWMNRRKGIDMAVTKLTKEDVAQQNASTIEMKDNKSNQMSQAVTMLAAMSGDDLTKLLAVLQQNSQSAAASIPNDAAAKNAASIAMKGVVGEELEVIFGGEELTEEFKEKITTLFEAAVNTKVQLELTEMEEKFDAVLEEQTEHVVEQLTDQLDKYLSYIAEEWMKENQIAIESSIRTEIAEQFIDGLKGLFKEHYIEIPDDKVDVLETYVSRVDELEEQLNQVTAQKIELEENLSQRVMEESFDSIADGLALTQVEKFRTLAEGIEFTGDVSQYQRKLNIIKEKHFNKKSVSGSDKSLVLSESLESGEDNTNVGSVDSTVMKYAEAISRTVKK